MHNKFRGRTVVLQLKFNDFRQITLPRTLPCPVDSRDMMYLVAGELLAGVDFVGHRIYLIGGTGGMAGLYLAVIVSAVRRVRG